MNRRELLKKIGASLPLLGMTESASSALSSTQKEHSYILNYRKIVDLSAMKAEFFPFFSRVFNCQSRDCAFIKMRKPEPDGCVIETQKAAREIEFQMFELAANPMWTENNPDYFWLSKAQSNLENRETKIRDNLERFFYKEFNYYPNECIVFCLNWDTALPADSLFSLKRGYIVYRTIGMIMLGI